MASVFFDPAVGGDGSTVTDDANPSTGLSNGGHRTRFVPALQQTVAVAANAKNSASAAAASAASALNAPGTSATSTDAITIGSGSKSMTIQTGKAFAVGQYLLLSATAGVWMLGSVSSYNSATGALVVAVEMYQGSGSYSAWTVTPTSPINPSTVIYALGYTPGGRGVANNWTAANDYSQSPTIPAPAVNDNSNKAISSAWYFGQAGSVNGAALGAASAGTSGKWAREDHVHPLPTTTTTQAADTNTTAFASCAFVIGQAGLAAPVMDGAATVGTSLRYARQDHIHPSDTSRGSLSGNNAWLGSNSFNISPTVPTPATGDNTGKVANTGFVQSQIAASVPWADTATGGRVRYATAAESRDFGNSWTALSPYALDQAYRGSNQGSRWQRGVGGRIRQWYTVAIGDIASGAPGSAWSVSFDIAFPAGVLGFSVQLFDAAAQGAAAPMVTGYSQWGINGYIEEWTALSQNATLFITVDGY